MVGIYVVLELTIIHTLILTMLLIDEHPLSSLVIRQDFVLRVVNMLWFRLLIIVGVLYESMEIFLQWLPEAAIQMGLVKCHIIVVECARVLRKNNFVFLLVFPLVI